MDQGILKNVFMNYESQILENFTEKLKDILTYLFKIEKQIDISFETIPHLFQTDGSVVPTYHHVYIKHNKEPLIPQQKPKWEMSRPNKFQEFFTHFRAFQIYDLRSTWNTLFHFIRKKKNHVHMEKQTFRTHYYSKTSYYSLRTRFYNRTQCRNTKTIFLPQ